MHDLKRCPNCLHEIPLAVVTPSTCFNCRTQSSSSLFQRVLAFVLTAILFALFFTQLGDSRMGVLFLPMFYVSQYAVLKIMGYRTEEVEVFFDINNNELNPDQEEIDVPIYHYTKTEKWSFIFEAFLLFIFLLITPLIIFNYVNLAHMIEGQIMAITMTISLIYFLLQVGLFFNEKWIYEFKKYPKQYLGYWNAFILLAFAFNTTFGFFSYYGFTNQMRLFLLPTLSALAYLAIVLQKQREHTDDKP